MDSTAFDIGDGSFVPRSVPVYKNNIIITEVKSFRPLYRGLELFLGTVLL